MDVHILSLSVSHSTGERERGGERPREGSERREKAHARWNRFLLAWRLLIMTCVYVNLVVMVIGESLFILLGCMLLIYNGTGIRSKHVATCKCDGTRIY